MNSKEGGDPYQRRPTDHRSRFHQENPFDDFKYTRPPPSRRANAQLQEEVVPSTSRTRQAETNRSIITAQGVFPRGGTSFKDRLQGSSPSKGDFFELSSSPQDNHGMSINNFPVEYNSSTFTGNHQTPTFIPRSHGLTRNQLMDSHSRATSGGIDDPDSFAFESTYEGYHTAEDIREIQRNRGGTPPNRSFNYYHQSPSYSMRGDTSVSPPSPQVLVAKGPGSNAAGTLKGSSTISFSNKFPSGAQVSNDTNEMLSSRGSTKAKNLIPIKKDKKKEKRFKFSPNSTAVSAVSDNRLYSGLNDAQLGFYMSTYNGGEPSNFHRPKVSKNRGFPKELPPRPAPREPQPVRVTAEARAQYIARKENQRLEMERRLAVPHLIRRAPPVSTVWGASFKLLTRNAWIFVVIAAFGLLSMVACLAAIITLKNVGEKSPGYLLISVPMIWWLVISAVVLCGGVVGFVVVRVPATRQRPNIGFRHRVGPREIMDGSLGRGGGLGSGFNGQSFEMVSGSRLQRLPPHGTTNGSPAPRREALSSFNTPKIAQNTNTEVQRQNLGESERGPVESHGFNQVHVRGAGEESYFERMAHSPEAGEPNHTGFIAASPVTPLTPLSKAVLIPTAPRNGNDFLVSHYRHSSRSYVPFSNPASDVPEDPGAASTRISSRSRDSLIAAAPHREQALKSLLGETPAPDTALGITDIYNRDGQGIESAALSQTSAYSYVPSPLKRVENEGPLERLEKILTHQSQQIATEQESPSFSRNPWRNSMNDNDEISAAKSYTDNGKGKGRACD
ncbi:hypothetical protein DSL72_004787 [Monilinia vaccinii-corymbosi]|uniref:Uncharacterized protein n=1 Tax=Monilinia vaccinii-corymbosi TaxID=61207 RepID=A0A8A3NX71_9HELO|nr:hypothetical protein DSL72_004787 [Monilinia vaccinii-corymbosi]